MAVLLPLLLGAQLLALRLTGVCADLQSYDELCDAIVVQAKHASRFHNSGDHAAASASMDAARRSFDEAVLLAPDEPQAYANFATFLLNTNQFDESLENWAAAAELVGHGPSREMILERARFTRFGRASAARDAAYRDGQGSLSEAVRMAELQLAEYPDHPEVEHDIGTLQIMRSELNASLAAVALSSLRRSQELAFRAWLAGKRSLGFSCKASHSNLVRDSSLAPGVEVVARHPPSSAEGGGSATYGAGGFVFEDRGWFIARHSTVSLEGGDGVITKATRSGPCRLFVPGGSSIYLNLASNVQMRAIWALPPGAPEERSEWHDYSKGRLPNHGARLTPSSIEGGVGQITYVVAKGRPEVIDAAASPLGYAVTSYYHFVTETLGRLMMLKPQLQSRLELRLLVPLDKTPNRFISKFIALLGSPFTDEDRMLWYDTSKLSPNDVRLRFRELIVPDWPSVKQTGNTSLPSDAVHCVLPRSVLRMVRSALAPIDRTARSENRGHAHETVPSVMPSQSPSHVAILPSPVRRRPVVVFASRGTATSRRLHDEAGLIAAVAEEATAEGVDFVVFEGSDAEPAETVALFSRAVAVVGVHGGALANVVFCRPGTMLVEMAPRSVQSWHFAHAAAALELEYVRIHLEPDERGIAASDVGLGEAGRAKVVSAIANKLLSCAEEVYSSGMDDMRH